MTSRRKLVVIALAVMLVATPLLAGLQCPDGTATCARVSECPLRKPICQRAADSQKPGTDAACQACGYTLLFTGRMSAHYPSGLQTAGFTMGASAADDNKSLADAFVGQEWTRSPRQLLHGALLI